MLKCNDRFYPGLLEKICPLKCRMLLRKEAGEFCLAAAVALLVGRRNGGSDGSGP